MTLSAELSSIGAARTFLRQTLAGWDEAGYDHGAAQVLTELATNAALHTRSPYTVRLVLEPTTLLVEVSDSSPVPPQVRQYGPEATTGRGIALVEALGTAWGVDRVPTGKTVWCRLAPDDARYGATRGDRRARPPGGGDHGPLLRGGGGGGGRGKSGARALLLVAA